jgi:hypothetical protein
MKAVVTQGKAVATIEVAVAGVSVSDILCEALGYAAIELYGILIQSVAPLRLYVQFSHGEGRAARPIVDATITFEDVPVDTEDPSDPASVAFGSVGNAEGPL